jgi:uncharacterized protein (TIGR00255 family)
MPFAAGKVLDSHAFLDSGASVVRSMTGYGAGESTHEGVLVKVELRAVNHRFFDPSIRISRDFQGLESRVKDALKERFSRGRISASVDVSWESGGSHLVLDEDLADEYRMLLRILEEKHGLEVAADAVAFSQLPDLVRREAREIPDGAVERALDESLAAATDQLLSMRVREGEALGRDLEARVRRLGELLVSVEKASVGASEVVRDRLRERVGRLVPDGVEVQSERLEQELALLAERADVTEELVRFRAHNEAFLAFLGKGEPVGKRLDFLLQEMNREANTIGSKSSDAALAHLVVEMKEEIERLREQVQNIE